MTGFPGTLNGAPHDADALALQAQTDLTSAYNDAASTANRRRLSPPSGRERHVVSCQSNGSAEPGRASACWLITSMRFRRLLATV